MTSGVWRGLALFAAVLAQFGADSARLSAVYRGFRVIECDPTYIVSTYIVRTYVLITVDSVHLFHAIKHHP